MTVPPGTFGAVLWLIALFIEYGYGLFPSGEGTLFTVNQAMFFVDQLCYVAAILGLIRAGAGGGWFARVSLGLFFRLGRARVRAGLSPVPIRATGGPESTGVPGVGDRKLQARNRNAIR